MSSLPVRRIYYWVHHTGRHDGNTGVQRVVRALAAALSSLSEVVVVPVRWCTDREAIVLAESAWITGLARFGGPTLTVPAGAGTPLHLAEDHAQALDGAWLIFGEVPHVVGNPQDAPAPVLAVTLDYARYYRLRVAVVFYDLIPLREPGYESLAAAHAAYATVLTATDVVLPISRTASADLVSWWREQGHDLDRLPQPRPVLLPGEVRGQPRITFSAPREREPEDVTFGARKSVRLLALGTVEPRKNQLEVMRTVNRLRRRRPELGIRLDVVGGLHSAVAEAVQQEAAQSENRIRLHGYLSDEAVRRLMGECDATVFLSLAEGFGLPVVEALWQGKPCLCSNVGSIAEIADGGGCLTIDPRDPDAIERALERLANEPELLDALAQQARERTLTRWSDYADAVLAELDAVPLVPVLVLIEGARGGGAPLGKELEAAGSRVWRHHWRPDTQAILPGLRGDWEISAGTGRGDLRGLWAILPVATAKGPAEVMRICDEASGLGIKLAVLVGADQPTGEPNLVALAQADLVLFADETKRDAALDGALRILPRTATLRHRFDVAGDIGNILAVIAARRERLTVSGAPPAPKRVFYWTGLTVVQSFNTGVQRVTRSLGRALSELGVEIIPVKWNETHGRMVPLDATEASVLAQWGGPPARTPEPLPSDLTGEWLLLPEITVPVVPAGSNVAKLGRTLGMRVAAIFYDLIPIKMAELYPPGTVAAFSRYWDLFGDVDVALPISWSVAGDLRRYLSQSGRRLRAMVVCPLAGDFPGNARQRTPREPGPVTEPFRLLAIGTWEPRKNYPRLLRALVEARRLAGQCPIQFTIVGRRAGYGELDIQISQLAAEAGDVELLDHVSDEHLLALFNRSDATLFGSWEEGFGLPILESLWRGLPCLCHDGSAMAEVAVGGGALAIDMLDETAIANGIARLAIDEALMMRLRREAVTRKIRTYNEYALDILSGLARTGNAPGWPLPAVLTQKPRPMLSCAVTTYNRAHWLKHSLPRLIEAARPFHDRVEVVVCDNASTDATPEVIERFTGTSGFSSRRNSMNVGMLGNLGATARATNGAYVWLIGDDDLIADGAIGAVLAGLEAHPDVEMAYLNYSYTSFDAPEQLSGPNEIMRSARPIGYGGPNRHVAELREVAALNENLFTAIYACVFRRDHALRAYQQNISGPPFSSLLTCVPSSVYAIAALQNRPAWWVGQSALVVNMNVSWLRWALLWHLERMPDLFDAAELAGIDPIRLDRHRLKHCGHAGEWARMALMAAEDPIREGFSVARLIERCKHIEGFTAELPKLRAAYREAWVAGRVVVDERAPGELFAGYGV